MVKMTAIKIEVSSQRKFFKISGWIELAIGALLVLLALMVFPIGWLFLGIVFILGGLISLGIIVVPEPEIWVRLRFGKARDVLPPGIHITLPFIDTVGKKSTPYEQLIDLIPLKEGELPKLNLHDGVVYPREYLVALKIGKTFEQIQRAVYGEKDWVDWVRNRLNSVIVGYVRTLSVADASDRGMLKGNLIDRIKEAESFSIGRLKRLRKEAKALKKSMEQFDEVADISNPLSEEIEEEIARVSLLPSFYKKSWEELENIIITEAPSRGIIEITGIFVGALKFSKEVEQARGAVQTERLKAEAALFKAIQEATFRIGPVINMKDKLQAAGMENETEAMKTALSFELLDTISKNGGAWALALNQGKEKQGEGGTVISMLMKYLAEAISVEKKESKEKKEGEKD